MTTEEFDKEFTFVYNCMKLDLTSYKQDIKEMEEKERTVYLFFQKYPKSLIEWREWFLGN